MDAIIETEVGVGIATMTTNELLNEFCLLHVKKDITDDEIKYKNLIKKEIKTRAELDTL